MESPVYLTDPRACDDLQRTLICRDRNLLFSPGKVLSLIHCMAHRKRSLCSHARRIRHDSPLYTIAFGAGRRCVDCLRGERFMGICQTTPEMEVVGCDTCRWNSHSCSFTD